MRSRRVSTDLARRDSVALLRGLPGFERLPGQAVEGLKLFLEASAYRPVR
jgi:hypothetical protein